MNNNIESGKKAKVIAWTNETNHRFAIGDTIEFIDSVKYIEEEYFMFKGVDMFNGNTIIQFLIKDEFEWI